MEKKRKTDFETKQNVCLRSLETVPALMLDLTQERVAKASKEYMVNFPV